MSFVKYKPVRSARKQHQCFGCVRTILPGESYQRMFVAKGGEVMNEPICNRCFEFMGSGAYKDNFPDNSFGYGELGDIWKSTP